ncbi:hypothetical protein RJ640_026949 [Escallonia rubra]|uniref:Uncharacterized protein n=1 Tax=Escallonia rubra TaxID=112253 RepID=A0AA88RC13_9ASTE|nr:hypothetical protein RJ640_026949 [Escallonia rubra]
MIAFHLGRGTLMSPSQALLVDLVMASASEKHFGRYPNEEDVNGLVVRDVIMNETMNGIQIKTWPNSPGCSAATNMSFQDNVMQVLS